LFTLDPSDDINANSNSDGVINLTISRPDRTLVVLNKIGSSPSTEASIVATKVVCDNETDLPNWGSGGPDITSNTAQDWVSNHNSCRFEPNWEFEWAYHGTSNPGDHTEYAGGGWTTFGPTNNMGVATTTFNTVTASKIWVREAFQSGYLGFTHATNKSDVSAEMYCHKDVLNYDNFDFIVGSQSVGTYHCVAFNKPLVVNQIPVITLLGNNPFNMTEGSTFTDPGATADDPEDGDITGSIVVGGDSVSSTTPAGTYTIKYNVKDSKGASAVEVTRSVVVSTTPPPPPPPPIYQCSDGIDNDGDGFIDFNKDKGCSSSTDNDETGPGGGGRIIIPVKPVPKPVPKPVQCNYLLEFLKKDADNNPVEVMKLQSFLYSYEGFEDLEVTGFFDQETFDAVSIFQERYRDDILNPWTHNKATGYVYITTKKKVNEIYCQKEFPLSEDQKDEIDEFNNFVRKTVEQIGSERFENEFQDVFQEIGQINEEEPEVIVSRPKEEKKGEKDLEKEDLTASVGFMKDSNLKLRDKLKEKMLDIMTIAKNNKFEAAAVIFGSPWTFIFMQSN